MTDFNYSKCSDGLYSIHPNSTEAVAMYASIVATSGPRLFEHEFKAFASQARRAGYSVRVEAAVEMSADDLFAELA